MAVDVVRIHGDIATARSLTFALSAKPMTVREGLVYMPGVNLNAR